MSPQDQIVHPVLLSGGSGTRLWPLSRALYPKQLLQFDAEEPLLLQTARRVQGERFSAPLIICNQEQRFLIAASIHRDPITPPRMLLEPAGRSTRTAAASPAPCVCIPPRSEERRV